MLIELVTLTLDQIEKKTSIEAIYFQSVVCFIDEILYTICPLFIFHAPLQYIPLSFQ